jgi:hypothetical protein
MFKPLGTLFKKETDRVWQERDIRYFIQEYLRRELKTDALHCEQALRGIITIRVSSPADAQEVYLLQYDLTEELEKEVKWKLKKLKVYIS